MSRTTLWLHAALCVLALGFAWRTAHTEKEKKGGPSVTVLLDADKGDVLSVDYTWDKGSTKTVVAGSPKMHSAVVDVDREVPKKALPKKKDDKDPKDEPPALVAEVAEREKATLPGGKNVITAIEALEPLKTLRTLGVVDDARLIAMGLQPPLRTLTVTTKKKKTLVLELGEASYGAQGRYARVKGDPVVHLIDAAIVTGLEGGADSLLEKRLLTAELDAINGFAVKSIKKDSEKTGSFIHVDKDQASTRYFAKKDDPGSKDEGAGKLMTSLRNLRGNKLVTAGGGDTDLGAVIATFTVDVAGSAVTIEIVERADKDAVDTNVGYVARVGRWVYELTATQSKELFDDVGAL